MQLPGGGTYTFFFVPEFERYVSNRITTTILEDEGDQPNMASPVAICEEGKVSYLV